MLVCGEIGLNTISDRGYVTHTSGVPRGSVFFEYHNGRPTCNNGKEDKGEDEFGHGETLFSGSER